MTCKQAIDDISLAMWLLFNYVFVTASKYGFKCKRLIIFYDFYLKESASG